MELGKVENEKKKFIKVSEQILQSIIESNYAQGDKLPPERKLADQMGVSRNSIREALGTLQALNIVNSRPGSGTYVKNVPDSKELESLILPVIEESESPVVVFEARKVFEPGVVRLVSTSLEERDFDVLKQILKKMEGLLLRGKYEEAYEANARFHLFIAKSVQNNIVKNTMKSLWKQTHNELLRETVKNYWRDNHEKAVKLHWDLLEAMEEKDLDRASSLVQDHYDGPKQYFLKNYGGDSSD